MSDETNKEVRRRPANGARPRPQGVGNRPPQANGGVNRPPQANGGANKPPQQGSPQAVKPKRPANAVGKTPQQGGSTVAKKPVNPQAKKPPQNRQVDGQPPRQGGVPPRKKPVQGNPVQAKNGVQPRRRPVPQEEAEIKQPKKRGKGKNAEQPQEEPKKKLFGKKDKNAEATDKKGLFGGKKSKGDDKEPKQKKTVGKKITKDMTKEEQLEIIKEENRRKASKKGSFKKKIPVFCAVAVVFIIVIAVAVLKNQTKSENTYYSIWQKVLSYEQGAFRYVFSINSNEASGGNKIATITFDDLNKSQSADSGEQSTDNAEQSSENVPDDANVDADKSTDEDPHLGEWTTTEGVSEVNNKYTNIRLVAEGVVVNNDPKALEGKVNFILETNNYKGKLFSVIAKDGNLYYDIEKLYKWLSSSKDSYLVKLAAKIPQGSKYLQIANEDFAIKSGFAELNENDGKLDSPMLWWECLNTNFGYLINTLSNLGSEGISKGEGETYTLKLTNKTSGNFFNYLASMADARSDSFDEVTDLKANYLGLSKGQKAQMIREKDNFVDSSEELVKQITSSKLNDLNLEVMGSSRIYKTDDGVEHTEATLSCAYTYDGTDWVISIGGVRTTEGAEITAPDGTRASISQDIVYDVLGEIADYLNPSSFALNHKLSLNDTAVKSKITELFINYMNDNSESDVVKLANAEEFINKYKNYKENETTTEQDKKNAQLVQNFYNLFSEVFSSMKVAEVENMKGEGEQYASVNNSEVANGVVLSISRDSKNSNDKLYVGNIVVDNTSEKNYTFTTDNLTLETTSGGIYKFNSKDALLTYNSSFDINNLKTSVEVPAGSKANITVYAVITGGLEKMDLVYSGANLGTLITH